MISYQGQLEEAVNKLSEEEAKDILQEIALSLSGDGGESDKLRCYALIQEVINRRIFVLDWYRVSLVNVEGHEQIGVSVQAATREDALEHGRDYFQEELVDELWELKAEKEFE